MVGQDEFGDVYKRQTLSLGEKSREAYERFFLAGANRYLLRHETCNEGHYPVSYTHLGGCSPIGMKKPFPTKSFGSSLSCKPRCPALI